MFGIGLPEMILILGLALIVVGPDKLPELARSLAKGLLELKGTAQSLKDNITAESPILKDIKPELENAAKSIKSQIIDGFEEIDNKESIGGIYEPLNDDEFRDGNPFDVNNSDRDSSQEPAATEPDSNESLEAENAPKEAEPSEKLAQEPETKDNPLQNSVNEDLNKNISH